MEMFGLVLACLIVALIAVICNHNKRVDASAASGSSQHATKETPEDIQNRYDTRWYGPVNPLIVCPHCQEKGSVRIKYTKQKKGISGAKATGAVLTGGWSLLATGLSKKEAVTQAHCGNCKVRGISEGLSNFRRDYPGTIRAFS